MAVCAVPGAVLFGQFDEDIPRGRSAQVGFLHIDKAEFVLPTSVAAVGSRQTEQQLLLRPLSTSPEVDD